MGLCKLLIVDDNKEFCELLSNFLSEDKEIDIVGIANNGVEAIEKIKELKPDVLLLDIVMPYLDGIGVLEKLKLKTSRPKIIVLTASSQETITQKASKLGVDYYLLKPFDLDILKSRIIELGRSSIEISRTITKNKVLYKAKKSTGESNKYTYTQDIKNSIEANILLNENEQVKDINIDIEVTNIISNMGIAAHLQGYQYLRDAILLAVYDIGLIGAMTKELYPAIAEKNRTKPSTVESSIRRVIELAWKKGKIDFKNIGFANFEKRKPTNSQLIATLADKLRLKYSIN